MMFWANRCKSKIGEQSAGDVLHNPVNSLQQPLSRPRTAPNGSPVPGVDCIQFQEVADLFGGETVGDVLFVAEDQKGGSHQFLLLEEGVQFCLGVLETEFVGAVDDPDDSVGLFEVVPPVGADGALSADVPDVEFVGVVVEGLDVEAQGGGDLVNVLPVELLDDRGLPRVVQAQHQQPHLLLFLLGLLHDRHEPHFYFQIIPFPTRLIQSPLIAYPPNQFFKFPKVFLSSLGSRGSYFWLFGRDSLLFLYWMILLRMVGWDLLDSLIEDVSFSIRDKGLFFLKSAIDLLFCLCNQRSQKNWQNNLCLILVVWAKLQLSYVPHLSEMTWRHHQNQAIIKSNMLNPTISQCSACDVRSIDMRTKRWRCLLQSVKTIHRNRAFCMSPGSG